MNENDELLKKVYEKRERYASMQIKKQEEHRKQIIASVIPQVDQILNSASKKVNAWRKPIMLDLSLDEPYKSAFTRLLYTLMGDYPDQTQETLDDLIEQAVLSRPYISPTSEYPYHLWIQIASKSSKMERIKNEIEQMDSAHIKVENKYGDYDYLKVTSSKYPDYQMTIYRDMSIKIGDSDDDDVNALAFIYTSEDAKAISYFANIAAKILGKEK